MDRRHLLNVTLVVGVLDALLLVVLVYVAFVNRDDDAVSVVGMIHGLGFVGLVGLTCFGFQRGHWGWWYPALVVVTGGPLGTLVGDTILRRRAQVEAG
jgi:hypothetical protein